MEILKSIKINGVGFIMMMSFINSCSNFKPGWKTIEVGDYLLDVPQDFRFKHQRGIDSEGGMITNDTIALNTDFGYFTDTLIQTPQEYLNRHVFIFDAQDQFMKPGVTYDIKNSPKIAILSIRPSTLKDSDETGLFSGADYIALCKHDNKVFNWPVRLPRDIKQHIVKIDTFNHSYRRLVLPKKGFMGETGIYMRDERSSNCYANRCYAIVIGADSLTLKQQAFVTKIFKTLRPKPVKG